MSGVRFVRVVISWGYHMGKKETEPALECTYSFHVFLILRVDIVNGMTASLVE